MNHIFRLLIQAACVVIIAAGVRIHAAKTLYIDYDEPVYLEAAIEYASHIRSGRWNMIAWSETNYEHPPLFKILYGIVILPEPKLDQLNPSDFIMLSPMRESQLIGYGMPTRYLSVFFATLTAGVLGMLNPIAGLFLAINTISVKYTSQIMLEALPLLTSFLSMLSYHQFFRLLNDPSRHKLVLFSYLVLSAIFLGITAASKFIYCVVGIAILIHFFTTWNQKHRSTKDLIAIIFWGLFSLIVFFVFNPYLWPHPWTRLQQTMMFHIDYAGSEHVIRSGYPFWQPLRWLYNPFEYFDPRPISAFIIQFDWLIALMAVIGLYQSYRKQLLYFIWFTTALVVLLLWNTKWPQYILILMIPYCMISAQGVNLCYDMIRNACKKSGGRIDRQHSRV